MDVTRCRCVSSHHRPWQRGFLQVVEWKTQHRERRWGLHFWGLWGKGSFPLRPGACRGALWTPAGAGRGVIVLHGCLFTMLTGLAYGTHPLHAALGCSSSVSSDLRLRGTLIGHNSGPEGALGKHTTSSTASYSGSSTWIRMEEKRDHKDWGAVLLKELNFTAKNTRNRF